MAEIVITVIALATVTTTAVIGPWSQLLDVPGFAGLCWSRFLTDAHFSNQPCLPAMVANSVCLTTTGRRLASLSCFSTKGCSGSLFADLAVVLILASLWNLGGPSSSTLYCSCLALLLCLSQSAAIGLRISVQDWLSKCCFMEWSICVDLFLNWFSRGHAGGSWELECLCLLSDENSHD